MKSSGLGIVDGEYEDLGQGKITVEYFWKN